MVKRRSAVFEAKYNQSGRQEWRGNRAKMFLNSFYSSHATIWEAFGKEARFFHW